MKRKVPVLLVLAAVTLAASLPSLAAASKQRVRFDRSATVGGAVLDPGEYRLELAPALDAVTFYSGKRAVVTAHCKVGLAQGRIYGDSVHFVAGEGGREVVTKLVFSGSRLSIELLPPAVDQSPIAQSDKIVNTPAE
jgi:hypothetical protein